MFAIGAKNEKAKCTWNSSYIRSKFWENHEIPQQMAVAIYPTSNLGTYFELDAGIL